MMSAETDHRSSLKLVSAILLALGTVCFPGRLMAKAVTIETMRDYAMSESMVSAKNAATVAWIVNDRGRRNIWVASGPGLRARQLTTYADDDGQEITGLSLSDDGKRVLYVLGGEHGANWHGDEPANPGHIPEGTKVSIWTMALSDHSPSHLADGDKPVLTSAGDRIAFIKNDAAWVVSTTGKGEARKAFSIRGRTKSLAWSPDGTRLAFVSVRDDHAFVGIYANDQTPIVWVAPSPAMDGTPRWSPDGKEIAFIRTPGSGGVPPALAEFEKSSWSIWVADPTTGTATRRWQSGEALRDAYYSNYLEWGDAGKLIFKSYMDGWQHLYALSPKDEKPLLLTPGPYMVDDQILSPDRRYIVFGANTGNDNDDIDRRHLMRADLDGKAPTTISAGTGLEWQPAIAGDRIAFISATALRTPQPATLERDGSIRFLSNQLLERAVVNNGQITPRRITFKASDGAIVHGQLFVPKGFSGDRPAVVYAHGGPARQMLLGWHPMGYYSNDYAVNQYLVSRGFVVLSVNYRLGVGYGHAFNFPATAGSRGASEYQDIEAAGRYLAASQGVDRKRIGIYGGSYGGFLTALALARNSDLFAAGVDIHGVHNWTTSGVGLKEFVQTNSFEKPADTNSALQIAWQSSPVASVASWKSPVLFIHGDDDRNVEVSQTIDLFRRLDATKVEHQAIILPDETHSILKYSNVLKMNRAIVDFLEERLSKSEGTK